MHKGNNINKEHVYFASAPAMMEIQQMDAEVREEMR